MQELSMNILDVAENSVRAGAKLVEISLAQDSTAARQSLVIKDDGSGMDAETAAKVSDPFYTTRSTRKVGLGLPFLKMAAEMTGGTFAIESAPGLGTTVRVSFTLGHIDLMPLGDMGSTISVLVQANPHMDFAFTFCRDGRRFEFTTAQAREILGDVPLSEPEVALFVRDYVNEGIAEVLEPPQ